MSDRKFKTSSGELAAGVRAACSRGASRELSRAVPLVALTLGLVWCQLSAVGLGKSVREPREAMQEQQQQTTRATPKPDEPFWREMERAIEARYSNKTLMQALASRNETEPQILRVTAKPGHWTFMLNNVTRIGKELRDVQPGDDISAALFKNWEPRWMDACDRRDPDERVTIWIGPEYERRFSLKEWEKKVNYRVVTRVPVGNDTQPARTKRAVPSGQAPGISPLPQPAPASSALAAAPSTEPSKRAAQALTRVTRTVIASDIWVSFQISAIDGVLASLRGLQANLSRAIDDETRSLGDEWPEVSPQRGAEIAGALDEWLPDWRTFVAADDTPSIIPNITGGIYVAKRHVILTNTSDYLQLFQVALEQMKYDHENLGRNRDTLEAVRQLDKTLSRLQCLADSLRDAVRDFHECRRAFVAQHSDSVALGDIDDKEVAVKQYLEQYRSGNLSARERPLDSKLEIESARFRAFGRLPAGEQKQVLDKMSWFLPENRPPGHVDSDHEAELPLESQKPRTITRRLAWPTHIWREVMPLQQRQLYNQRERAIRDRAVLKKLPPALLSVQSLMDFQWTD